MPIVRNGYHMQAIGSISWGLAFFSASEAGSIREVMIFFKE